MSTDDDRRAVLRHLLGQGPDDPNDDQVTNEPEPTGMRAFLRTLNNNPTD